MIRKYHFSLLLFALLTLLVGCNRNVVTLDYTNARGEVPQLGNLIFRFSQPLVTDSQLNKWDSANLIQFEPAIPGRFRWEKTDELVFSPGRPLSPAASFKAVIKSGSLARQSSSRIEGAEDLRFHTAYLRLDDIHASWVLPEGPSKTPVPQAELAFNYAVDPSVIRSKLRMEVDGEAVEYDIRTLSPSNLISIRLPGVQAADKAYDLRLLLEKGVLPEGGTNGTPEAAEIKAEIPSPFVLSINDVKAQHDGIRGTIMVKTSQQVVPSTLASFIRFKPAVKFTVETTTDGFMISSEGFDAESAYSLTLLHGIRGEIGGSLREDYFSAIAFGQLEPSIRFGNAKAVYLSGNGQRNMEIKITSVDRLKLVVSRIYENNLLAAGKYDYYPRESGEEDAYYPDYIDYTPGDIIYEQEIDTRSLPKYGNSRLLNFNLADHLPDLKGVYHVMIRSANNYWVRDSRFISVSDIGLIAREARDKLVVFANSIQSAEPASGVRITIYSANNQVLGTGTTNDEGVAEIGYIRRELAGFRPAMIIASTANDFNYLPFNGTKVNTSRFEVGGRHTNKTGLDAFIYGERDIYRPGERINFSVIVRDADWRPPGAIPVKLKFLLPNGRELKTFRKSLNEQGSLEGFVDIAAAGITGAYSLEVYTSNDVLLSSKPFMVEEFVPDRIKVSAKLDKPFLAPGDAGTLQINAVNFFGPPASGRRYEAEIQLKQKLFNPKKITGYDFSLANQTSFFDKIVREGKTDDAGNASERYQVPAGFRNMGILRAVFYATVFDETGRPVSRNVATDVYTQPVFAGIGSDGYNYFPLNQVIRFPLIALDKNETVQSGISLEVKVVKHEYRTVLSKNGGYFSYRSQKEDKLISSERITVNGQNTGYTFVPRSPGDYELRVSLPGAETYVSRSFYSYGSWGGDNNSFEVNNEGNIDIELDKPSYQSDGVVRALFKTPFSGRMLVTLESDKLVYYRYIDVTKRSASLELPLKADYLPNVYITATLIKPHAVSDLPLTVAYGFRNVKVEENRRKIPVEILAQSAVRSQTRQKVKVKAAPGSFVTLAAVDNGVLQVSDYDTPDPYRHFYATRALEVTAYTIYPLLFPELRATLSSTGGDGGLSMEKRINPIQNKRVQIVSYWSGISRASAKGEADFDLAIPAFSGEIRLMAVAYDKERFGSGEATMKVADPVVISTAVPRFLSPKDTITVPVTISNTTSRPESGNASLKVSGPLTLISNRSQSVQLAPGAEQRVYFTVAAEPSADSAKIVVEVQTPAEKFSQETHLTVRPPAGLQRRSGGGTLEGGSRRQVTIEAENFIPPTADYSLVISRSPALELAGQLNHLLLYPYGCTEQAISAAFPQLYYGDMADLLQTNRGAKGSAISNVQEVIRKIKMRQLYNGAVTLWDNAGTENWWVTVYAAHFLVEAQKAGFEVEKSLLDPMLSYIGGRLRNRETITYYYNRDQQKKIAPKEVAYSLYLLALAGRPDISVMNYYKAVPERLSLDSRYLLSAAYALAGDKQKFRELLPDSFLGEESVPQAGGSFYSPVRDEAMALNVLLEVDPGNVQVQPMAKQLIERLKVREWYNTQESAFSFLAIGKLARLSANTTATATVLVNGKTVGTAGNTTVRFSRKQLGSTQVTIATNGTGRLFYWWQSEGISRDGSYKEEDNFIKARKRFFDRYGREINGRTFRQNDLVIVQLTLERAYSAPIENIVLTDLLPAGFEIENPRTKDIPGTDWIKDAATPIQLDVRDDRINFFLDLNRNKQVYYYAVRAVSPGTYHMGPVSADAMYNGEYHSYHGAGLIKVEE